MKRLFWKLKKNFYRFIVHHMGAYVDLPKYERRLNRVRKKLERRTENPYKFEIHNNGLSIISQLKSEHINKILIIGRIKEADSIANHTRAFLEVLDYDAYEVYLFDEYKNKLYFMKNKKDMIFIKESPPKEIDGSKYDLLLFLGVISHGNDSFADKVPTRKAFISLVYSVYDGTVPPKGWVDAVNDYFDALLVPVENLKQSFINHHVLKPIFVLPVSLDLKKYLIHNTLKTNKKFTFGWIGTAEDRKNVIKIVHAFEKAFGNNPEVQLRLHTRFIDERTTDGIELKKIISSLPKNILLTVGVIADDEITKLMFSFDAYVYVSKGEGYSVTPREALACGQAVILSAIPTHKTILTLSSKDGVYWVPADIEIDAIQPSLNNQICGKMYDIKERDLMACMKKLYQERESIYREDKIMARKKAVEIYDKGELKYLYKQLICPQGLTLGHEDALSKDSITTRDINLQKKYMYFIKNQRIRYIVCPIHDGGFCSIFNKYISHLVYGGDNVVLIPDWRVSTLKLDVLKRNGKLKFESFCYGKEEDGNIFFKLFQDTFLPHLTQDIYQTNLMYVIADKVLDSFDFNSANEPNLTYIHSYNLYADESYFMDFRKKYNYYFNKYIKLQPDLQNKIDEFYNSHMKDKFVVSAQIRCAAHALELLKGDKPTLEKYDRHLQLLLSQNNLKIESDDWRFFIATDNDVALNYFRKKYRHHILSQEMERLSEQQENEYKNMRAKLGKDIPGFELQHRAANDEKRCSLDRACEILFDVYLLSKAKYFIFVNSNISTMVSYINPDITMVYCK